MPIQANLNNTPTLQSISERDVDLLLLEELKCNSLFVDWCLQTTIGKPPEYEFVNAWHSLTKGNLGESDIVFMVKINNETHLFLVENKIDADFQPNQAERYRQRGTLRQTEGECHYFYTVLVAPAGYIGQKEVLFDYSITYESIKDWFAQQKSLGLRGQYKMEVIEVAIEKKRRGYVPADPNEGAGKFWQGYYQYVTAHFPHLNMNQPDPEKSAGSTFIDLRSSHMTSNKKDKIVHKFGHGFIDLQLSGQGDQISLLKEKYADVLTPAMQIVLTGKSASIRIIHKKIDQKKGFDAQFNLVKEAIDIADELYQWGRQHL